MICNCIDYKFTQQCQTCYKIYTSMSNMSSSRYSLISSRKPPPDLELPCCVSSEEEATGTNLHGPDFLLGENLTPLAEGREVVEAHCVIVAGAEQNRLPLRIGHPAQLEHSIFFIVSVCCKILNWTLMRINNHGFRIKDTSQEIQMHNKTITYAPYLKPLMNWRK